MAKKRTNNTMAKNEQITQWPKKNKQHNGQKRTYNTMAKKEQTT